MVSYNAIKQKVQLLTRTNDIQSLSNAIDYLLQQIKTILSNQISESTSIAKKQLVQSRISRSHSEKCFSSGIKEFRINDIDHDEFCKKLSAEIIEQEIPGVHNDVLEGSRISFLQQAINFNSKRCPKIQKQHPNHLQNNLNLKDIQLTIQIYHQAFGKSLQYLQKLCQHQSHQYKVINIKKPYPQSTIHQFWQNFNHIKRNCTTFEDLMSKVQCQLSQNFLKALYTVKKYFPVKSKEINIKNRQFILLPYKKTIK